MIRKKDFFRYGLAILVWLLVFFLGFALQRSLLFCYLDQEVEPLSIAYRFFGAMTLLAMLVMEYFTFKKADKVMLVYMVALMMKMGMFAVFHIQLEDTPQQVLYSMAVPMICFLLLQTVFIVYKLNRMNFGLNKEDIE